MNIRIYIFILCTLSSYIVKIIPMGMGEVAAAEFNSNLLFLTTLATSGEKTPLGSSPHYHAYRPTSHGMSVSPIVSDRCNNSRIPQIIHRPVESTAQEVLNDAKRASKFWNMSVMQILKIHLEKEKEGLRALKEPYVTGDHVRHLYKDPTLNFDYTKRAYYIHETEHEINATERALVLAANSSNETKNEIHFSQIAIVFSTE